MNTFVELLDRWRLTTNLVSNRTFNVIWTRHIANSAQLRRLVPSNARTWLDLGSGAGFPAVVIAIQLVGVRGATVHCVESDHKKCSFLREVARTTGAPLVVHCSRIEVLPPTASGPVDVVTARGFAPLPVTLDLAKLWLAYGAQALFPRGRTWRDQLGALADRDRYGIDIFRSMLDPKSAVFSMRLRRGQTASYV